MLKTKAKTVTFTILMSSILLSSCSLGLNNQGVPQQVVGESSSLYYTVNQGDISASLIGTGQLVPIKATSLYFNNVSGPVSQLNYSLNDTVKKGSLFAQILPTEIENKISMQRIVVQKGKGRLRLLLDGNGEVAELRKSIELTKLDLESKREQKKNLPKETELAINKAKLVLEQYEVEKSSTMKSQELAEIEQRNVEDAVRRIEIRLEQVQNQIQSSIVALEREQLVYDNLIANAGSAEDIKIAAIRLEQAKLSLSNSEKDKAITELDLKLALVPTEQYKMDQAALGLEGVTKSIEGAGLTLDEIKKNSDQKMKLLDQGIQETKIQIDLLNLRLNQALKEHEFNTRQAKLDQESAELTLSMLEQNLLNSKLYAPVDGVVSYMSNVSITDNLSISHLLAKIADPNQLALKLTAIDAKYISDVSTAVLVIGSKKYDVELYTPQPGDALYQNSAVPNNSNLSNLFVKFKGEVPKLKFEESVQVQLEVVKENVLLVPKSNLKVESGKVMVDVQRNNEIVTVEITRGIESDVNIEVANGLEVGDQIVRR
ncbi:hypothetical protein BCM02_11612 [Paenibacillus methanolicus]|uniref:HlyD family secretion protein n=2 Tax=Paenibacillus methanolicus TaxID=582686 RepID=A0A5S5BS70_9BACL|nr:hypothetical protein BCM02_11612 [Paenibacillus methanolicus]